MDHRNLFRFLFRVYYFCTTRLPQQFTRSSSPATPYMGLHGLAGVWRYTEVRSTCSIDIILFWSRHIPRGHSHPFLITHLHTLSLRERGHARICLQWACKSTSEQVRGGLR